MSVREQVFGEPGYSTDICLSAVELSFFRQAIYEQWLTRIANQYPGFVDSFIKEGIQNYHYFSDQVNHAELWQKRWRSLPQKTVDVIKEFRFIKDLQKEFGSFSISSVVNENVVTEGEEEIYWRLVMPGVASDVGPLHADKWFHNLAGEYGMFPPGTTTVKIWLAINTEPNRNGLIVVPNSHTRNWKYNAVEKEGVVRPCIAEDVDALDTILVPTESGRLIIFNERLLHGGSVNHGKETRISAEITMVLQ